MAFVNHSIHPIDSDQEEFFYHSSEAKYHLEQIQKCLEEIKIHKAKMREHAAYAQEIFSNRCAG